ncbi:MAG: primase [Verrucomicrobiota bacterium]|jgi:DNA primase
MAGLIPPDKLEQIRAASDIVDVIGAAIPLKRAGANFVALCPFHREKSPSFNVNPSRQIYHCFGCHKGGDVFGFVRDYENLSFVDAVRRLAERANIPLEFENTPGAGRARALKDSLLLIHEQICQRWQTVLANDAAGQAARDYLAGRGVGPEAVQLFRLGAAPEAWDDTVNWARSKGHDLALVEQAGLILRKEGTDRHYDRFRGRLMFPICDEQGRVVAFSGRLLTPDAKAAKYVNSPETPIFSKGRVFYGLDKSKRAILDAGCAVLCEGQLDLIACHMAGVRNVVAPQGTAFTPDHARLLKRYASEVVLCFDSDNAGQNASVRALDSLLGAELAVRVAALPSPHDPDSYIKEFGGPAFAARIAEAEGFFDFYLRRLSAVHDAASDRGRVAIVHEMAEALHKTGSPVLLDTYAQKTALRLGVDPGAVRAEFRKRGRARPGPGARVEEEPRDPGPDPELGGGDAGEGPPGMTLPPPSEREFWLLRFVLSHDDQVDWLARHLNLDWVVHPLVRRIIGARLAAHVHDTWRGVPALCDELDDPAAARLVTETSTAGGGRVKEDAQEMQDYVSRNIMEAVRLLRNDYLDRALAACRQRLLEPGLGPEAMAALLEEQVALRRAKQAPLG